MTKVDVNNKKYRRVIDLLGWVGFFLLVTSFMLVSFGMINGRSYYFLIPNLIGCVLLALVSYSKKAYQPAVLNVIFVLIAIISIVTLMFST